VSAWDNDSRITYTYSISTGISELFNRESFIVYPNPAKDIITIKGFNSMYGSRYSITDEKGAVVLQGKLFDDNSTIDISSLSKGIYIIYFGEGGQHAFKVIKGRVR
jgi:hypothetical protein